MVEALMAGADDYMTQAFLPSKSYSLVFKLWAEEPVQTQLPKST